jgi:hypothetical protein
MKAEPDDKRGTKKVVATAEGRRRVEAWLCEAPAWVGDVAEDPIRTRVHFLALLSPAKRAAAVRDMVTATRASISQVDAHMRVTDKSDLNWIILQGVRTVLEARATWLTKVGPFFACK